jgi:winged helix-turn-helix protein
MQDTQPKEVYGQVQNLLAGSRVKLGSKVHFQRGWKYLKRINYSKRVLRPRHAKADLDAQEAFKETSRATKSRSASVSSSQHRIGSDRSAPYWAQTNPAQSLGAHRLAWACRGTPPLPATLPLQFCASSCWTNGVDAFSNATVRADVFTIALAQFAQAIGAGSGSSWLA